MKRTYALNFIRSAIAPVNNNGVITANIISNFTNRTPGIVGAYLSELSKGTPLRNVQSKLPTRPAVSGPNVRLNPNINHITLKSAIPKKICIKMETVFFLRSNPASNNPRAGIISNTRLEAISIQAVSPEFIGTIFLDIYIINIIVIPLNAKYGKIFWKCFFTKDKIIVNLFND